MKDGSPAEIINVTWENVFDRIMGGGPRGKKVWGVPRGGSIVAGLLQICKGNKVVDFAQEADIIVDDIIDTGKTKKDVEEELPGKGYWALVPNKTPGKWVVFPWEEKGDQDVQNTVVRQLQYLGEDPLREGLKDTPARVIKSLKEMTGGYLQDPAQILARTFKEPYDQMVVVRDIDFWSLCEHHMLPFHGTVTVAYLPNGKVVGLSKIPRLVHCFAKRLQVQERLTQEIANAMNEHLDPLGVGVAIRASHLCMTMRGIKSPSEMVTSCLLGAFRKNAEARSEFLALSRCFMSSLVSSLKSGSFISSFIM